MGLSVNVSNSIKYNTTSTLLNALPSASRGGSMENLTNTILGNTSAISLTDYASIKNGSYGKLLKAYYSNDTHAQDVSEKQSAAKSKSSTSATGTASGTSSYTATSAAAKEKTSKLSEIQTAGKELKETTDAMLSTGSSAVFKSATGNDYSTSLKDYDSKKITDAVNSLVKNYNTMVSDASGTGSAKISRAVSSMTDAAGKYASQLKKVGITVGSDNKLTVDADKLKSANVNDLKALFHTTGSFVSEVRNAASLTEYYAGQETGTKASYSSTGAYNATSGLLNSMFSSYS